MLETNKTSSVSGSSSEPTDTKLNRKLEHSGISSQRNSSGKALWLDL